MGTKIPFNATQRQQQHRLAALEMSTAELGLNVRITNCLEGRGIYNVRDLLRSTPDNLLSISNFGEKTLEEVCNALETIGFYRASRRPSGGDFPKQPR